MTLAKHLHKGLRPDVPCPSMEIRDMCVLQGLIAQQSSKTPQLIQVDGLQDLSNGQTKIYWYSTTAGIRNPEPFASAIVVFGAPKDWLCEWQRLEHLVGDRIQAMDHLAATGAASKLSRKMAYHLFGNLVDYADKYQGMQSVILHDLEAVADIKLATDVGGTWLIPPHFIDSVCHLAGMILNGSEAANVREYFYVTPGWGSMRFTVEMQPDDQFRSYVKMRSTSPGYFKGDVYILKGSEIIGMVGDFTFRRFPRSLLSSFFSDAPAQVERSTIAKVPTNELNTASELLEEPKVHSIAERSKALEYREPNPSVAVEVLTPTSTSLIDSSLELIARECGCEVQDLRPESEFLSLGVDSLMSLVLSERFRTELNIEVKSTIFLESQTVHEFKEWLSQQC